MKTLTALLFTLFFALTATAQDEADKTISKQFTSNTGTLYHKDFQKVASLKVANGHKGEFNFNTVNVKNLNTNSGVSFVKLEYKSYYTENKDVSTTLDIDEIDGLIKAISTINSTTDSLSTNYTELNYYSKSGFEIGAFFSKEKKAWSYYVKMEKYKSLALIDRETNTMFMQLLTLCKKKAIY